MEIMEYVINDHVIRWVSPNSQSWAFRENGPCRINKTGEVFFSQLSSSFSTRKQGPSLIRPTGEIVYKDCNGVGHRTDGPARIYADGGKEYWVNGVNISPEEFFLRYGVL